MLRLRHPGTLHGRPTLHGPITPSHHHPRDLAEASPLPSGWQGARSGSMHAVETAEVYDQSFWDGRNGESDGLWIPRCQPPCAVLNPDEQSQLKGHNGHLEGWLCRFVYPVPDPFREPKKSYGKLGISYEKLGKVKKISKILFANRFRTCMWHR